MGEKMKTGEAKAVLAEICGGRYTATQKIRAIEHVLASPGGLPSKYWQQACAWLLGEYRHAQETVAAQDLALKRSVRAADCFDDGMERWACECGNLFCRRQPYCDRCGARLVYK